MRKQMGITLLELLATLSLMGILLAMAIPSWDDVVQRNRLKQVTERLYSDMKFAHAESIRRQQQLFITIQSGSNWCYGMDDAAVCDCSVANSCQIDGVETVVNATNYPGSSLALSGFTAGGGGSTVTFEGIRGLADASGTVTWSQNGDSTKVQTNRMGLMSICSDDLSSYNACP